MQPSMKLDMLGSNADRFTFGVWQFLKTDHATGAKTNFDYYATLSVDRSAITGSLSANPDVYLRIVKKSDGSEVYTRTLKAGESNISLPSYITNNNSDVTNTLTYAAANGTNPGNVTFSLVNANLEYETLQIRDTNYPGNENEDKPNVKLRFLMQLLSKQLTISLSKVTLLQVNFTNLLEVKQIWQAIRKKVLQVNNLQLQTTAISLVTNM